MIKMHKIHQFVPLYIIYTLYILKSYRIKSMTTLSPKTFYYQFQHALAAHQASLSLRKSSTGHYKFKTYHLTVPDLAPFWRETWYRARRKMLVDVKDFEHPLCFGYNLTMWERFGYHVSSPIFQELKPAQFIMWVQYCMVWRKPHKRLPLFRL